MALTQYEATYLHEIAEGFTARRPIRRSWRIRPNARDNAQSGGVMPVRTADAIVPLMPAVAVFARRKSAQLTNKDTTRP